MRRRVFWSILLTSFLVLAITVSVVMITVYNEFADERKTELRTETAYIAAACKSDYTDYLGIIGASSKNRLTLVAPDGTVIYDNSADISSLGNHSDRPEIASAVQTGEGEITRTSDTLGENTFYYAVRLEDGNILRVASSMKGMLKLVDNTGTYIFLTVLLAVAIAVFTAYFVTKRIVEPINAIDTEHPLDNVAYDELSPLLVRMDKQNKTIDSQLEELGAKQREFTDITDSMSEALIIFGSDKRVLTANRSAKRVFSAMSAEGLGYLELCRDLVYIKAVESAFSGKSAEEKLEICGRAYRLTVNPVSEHGDFAAVLFAVDITDAERSEQLRREFSANVSHELKTPLTSILGYTELMTNGVAKTEDFPAFAKHINDEASRLLSLIEDIIKLSRLDEGGLKKQFEKVDLYDIAEKTVSELARKAEADDVSMTLSGEHLFVEGIENTLHEMIFNLCDNAVSYNRRGGRADVKVYSENGHTVVSVSDTGIGIAPEEQARIFERFYRVDKSHSKATGGTGLGLSIVKHGALLHGAEIRLSSTLGKGSEISLVF